ncbi:MAG: uroporphyrinogen decarboxylase [Planctomycetaceae bacterium]|nr:uroporphyrinogen decarboxylase [Planctomycetota bacterium]NUO15235.1 uroporphyrinogen decarboxylase [Planctomycetaceae bacterium]HRJ79255.1 uroporphyrinogen decarboxylase [Planctomycetota bacterium]
MNDNALHNSRFLKACRGEPVDATPIWLMRQAGRYMPEYQAVRGKSSFLELCKSPERSAQVTLDAQRILGVDAAILFADLLPILETVGLKLEYLEGEGPRLSPPVRTSADIHRLREEDPAQSMPFVYDAIRIIRKELPRDIPLIGFAGAPFTLAAYAIEGESSRNFIHTKTLMYSDPRAWHALLGMLARLVGKYLNAQIDAGVQAVQLFDSWVGTLSPEDYREYVLPHSYAVLQSVKGRVPVIHFGVGTSTLLPFMAAAGGDVLGLDWHTPIALTREKLKVRAVQGNLDPICLFADREVVRRKAMQVLDDAGDTPGHIFNLGHGILPRTPVDNVKFLVDFVHESTRR